MNPMRRYANNRAINAAQAEGESRESVAAAEAWNAALIEGERLKYLAPAGYKPREPSFTVKSNTIFVDVLAFWEDQ